MSMNPDMVAAAQRRLKGIIPASNAPAESYNYAFNPEYSEGVRRLLEQRANLESQAGLGTQRVAQDFSTGMRDLGLQRDEGIRGVRNQMAGQGLFRSGINVQQQGRVQEGYGRAVEGLAQGRTRSLEDIQRGLATGLQDIQGNQNQLDIARARAEEQRQAILARQEAERLAREELIKQIQGSLPQLSPTGQYQQPGYY